LCWTVKLSDNSVFHEDDQLWNHLNLNNGHIWLDLKNYVESNNLSIVKLSFNYNNNTIKISGSADGYTFSKGLSAHPGETPHNYYVVGKLRGNLVHVNWWRLPGLTHIPERKEVRPVSRYEKLLIRNYHE